MKKQRKKPNAKARSTPQGSQTPSKPKSITRRQLITYGQTGALAAVALGGGGFLFARSVRASIAEQDLERVGTGTPAIVQIHDPECSLCLTLQREARTALKGFEEEDLIYLVANIKTPVGREFANRYGASHVTLLLFDGQGTLQNVLSGSNTSTVLASAFKALSER